MDVREKLEILADAAKYDASCASSGSYRPRTAGGLGNTEGMGICHSYTPDGRCVSLLKILLTNYCIYDCRYCINRVSSDTKRARMTPAEVAWLTIEFYKRNYIEGLFLSSGVISSPDETMRDLIQAAQILRTQYQFCGYIHLKAVPGASADLIKLAGQVADRVSANWELPAQKDLNQLAPGKTHAQVEAIMTTLKSRRDEWVDDNKKKPASPARTFLPAGQSTQIIVGATTASDKDYLQKSTVLYSDYKLRRVYYSAFSPIPDGDKELPLARPPLLREHRLYQADWLMRHYGFQAEEIATEDDGNLSLEMDPKLAWAVKNRHLFPIDINKASREQLLRIPGFGVRGIDRLIAARRHRQLTVEALPKLGLSLKRARPFIVAAGPSGFVKIDTEEVVLKKTFIADHQLSLFDVGPSRLAAVSGEM